MSNLYEVIERVFISYKSLLFALFMFIVFALASYFVYTRYISDYIKNKKYADVANSASRDEALQIYFFYADWCPHCKTAKPGWNQFKSKMDGSVVNGYTIETIGVDCTNLDSDPESAQLVKENDVSGFPSIIAFKDNKRIDYDAKVNLNSLNQFVAAITK